MPRYTYYCDTCEETFNITHSMSEECDSKDGCNNDCKLEKLPSNLTIINNSSAPTGKKVGQVVKKSIEDSRQELKEERKKLLNKVYEDD